MLKSVSLQRTLNVKSLDTFHLQRVQLIITENYPALLQFAQNSHGVWHNAAHNFTAKVWAYLVNDCLIGQSLLPFHIATEKYRNYLKQVLPGLLDDVPVNMKHNIWFEYDGAQSHFEQVVRMYLNRSLPHR